jgi:two-component system sensor histidine kinase YesM
MKKIRDMNLGKKLILAYICVIAVPIIIISFYIFKEFEDNTIKELIIQNEYIVSTEKANINSNISVIERTTQLVLANKNFINFVNTTREVTKEEFVEYSLNTYLDILQLQYNNPEINRIKFYVNESRYIPEIWPIIYHEENIKEERWFDKVIDNGDKGLWILNQKQLKYNNVNYNQLQEVVSFYKVLNLPYDNRIGLSEVNMSLQDFFVRMFNEADNGKRQFFVIKDNTVITNQDNNFLDNEDLDSQFIINKFNENLADEKKSFIINNKGVELIFSYEYINAIDGYILIVNSTEEILSDIIAKRNAIVGITIVLIGILSLITYLITSLILNDLKLITEELKKMKEGDFNINLPMKNKDEVGELAYHFRQLFSKLNQLVSEIINKELVAKESELRALQSQIDSHFLYNSLENIKMMAEIEGMYKISDSLTSLGDMFRYNIKWESQFSTLDKELEYIDNYVALLNVRFNNRINLIKEIPEDLLNIQVLKMSIQPLVENSIKHGLKEKISNNLEKGNIIIRAFKQSEDVAIEVEDNGIGISPYELHRIQDKIKKMDGSIEKVDIEKHLKDEEKENIDKKASNGIAFANINGRMQMFYGKEYGINIFTELSKFTKVRIIIPFKNL